MADMVYDMDMVYDDKFIMVYASNILITVDSIESFCCVHRYFAK